MKIYFGGLKLVLFVVACLLNVLFMYIMFELYDALEPVLITLPGGLSFDLKL